MHGLRVVSLDLLGFGLSDKPKDATYTAQSMAGSALSISDLTCADQVRDLLLFLQVPPVHVVAHDIGTDVALLFAAQNANWVRSITLCNPARSGLFQKASFLATVSDGTPTFLSHLMFYSGALMAPALARKVHCMERHTGILYFIRRSRSICLLVIV